MQKKIVRPQADFNNLLPIKYNWAYEMYLKACNDNWMPFDIPMQKDVSDFKLTLNEAERHVFVDTLSFLTTADVAALRNVECALIDKIHPPEMQMFLSRQGFDESVHMLSYAHAIQTIGLKEEEVYNKYKTVPAIGAKINALESHSEVIALLDNNLTDGDELQQFLQSYFFFAGIFEGSSFLAGFNPIFSLKRRNLMQGTAEQLQYIRRDEMENHVSFGLGVINSVMQEENVKLDKPSIDKMVEESYELEVDFIDHILRDPIVGYSKEQHLSQYKFFVNSRLRSVGLPAYFHSDAKQLSWLGEVVDVSKERNFFETRVIEYQVGANLNWGECSSGISSDWKEDKAADIPVGAVCNMEEGCDVCQ